MKLYDLISMKAAKTVIDKACSASPTLSYLTSESRVSTICAKIHFRNSYSSKSAIGSRSKNKRYSKPDGLVTSSQSR